MPLRIDFLDRRTHLSYMQQSAKRLTILLTKDELVAIDDFRLKTMRNRSDAGRALLKLALDQIGEDPAKPP